MQVIISWEEMEDVSVQVIIVKIETVGDVQKGWNKMNK